MSKQRFEEIMEEINELTQEAYDLLPENEKPSARGYWFAHIKTAIYNDTEFLGNSMITMEDSLKGFEEEDNEDED